jgi:hypothetical protein
MFSIFLTDLAAYNEGFLSGKWIELPIDEEELKEEIKNVLETGLREAKENNLCCCSEHEEYFITDYEGFSSLNEYEDIFKLNENLNELIDLQNSYSIDDEILQELLNYFENIEDVKDIIEEGNYRIYYDVNNSSDICYQDYREGLYGELGNDYLSRYIDFDQMGSDRELENAILFFNKTAIEIF